MLRSISKLIGFTLLAADGEVGSCADFLFDDQQWKIRYMVAKTGGWLSNRKVLLSPESLREPQWDQKKFPVGLTKEQIENAPPLDSDAPVSRQYQLAWTSYYRLSPYWQDLGPLSAPLVNNEIAMAHLHANQDDHLRSCHEVFGYELQTKEAIRLGDTAGVVRDFLLDDQTWQILYAAVEITIGDESRSVLIDRSWLETVGWTEKSLHTDVSTQQLHDCPKYDPERQPDPRLNENEFGYYGLPK